MFSPDRVYRYTLERPLPVGCVAGCRADAGAGLHSSGCVTESSVVLFIGLNPSTADAETNDPTVRRMIGFARRWGYGRLVVCNIFALRSTDPKALYTHPDPVGSSNDWHLWDEAQRARMVVAAWGNHGAYRERSREVEEMLRACRDAVHVLDLNKSGQPKHPLYVRGDTRPVAWA